MKRGGIYLKSKASILMSLDPFTLKMWPHRVNKNMALHFDGVYTDFLFSFLSLLAHSLPCTFPPVEPISSVAQSLLCTPKSEVLISSKELDETGLWFFPASVRSNFQNVCGWGSRVAYELLYSMTYWQICNCLTQTKAESLLSTIKIGCSNNPTKFIT